MERKFIEAIRRETSEKITMHPCGNWFDGLDLVAQNQADCYFLGPNCWPPAKTPFINYDTAVYAARKYGRYENLGV